MQGEVQARGGVLGEGRGVQGRGQGTFYPPCHNTALPHGALP